MSRPPFSDIDATRRRLLRTGWRFGAGLASMSALPAARAEAASRASTLPERVSPPQVAFLSPEAGAAALARVAGDTYYANMGLLEIRARMRSPLASLSLAEARRAVRDADAAAVLPFTDEERIALVGVIERMQPVLAARAPLHARTPWSFIKLDDRAEGGVAHTRGPHIVLPRQHVESYAKMHRELGAAGTLAQSTRGRGLLVHEQTHVLERASPARFEPLYTDVFGFTRMMPAPTTPWLDAHVGTNPDGPDVVWAFPLDKIGGHGWVMPDVIFLDVAQPRMPRDFQAVAIEVAKTADGWMIVEEDGQPKRRDLDKVPGYHAHFPFPDEDFHPAEIAAVALSHWILRDVPDVEGRPLMPGIAGWAKKALA
jgi:hypothetical protein